MIRKDGDMATLSGWSKGVHNTESNIPGDALRAALNVDLSDEGKPRRRRGYTRVLEGARVQSLFGHENLSFMLVRVQDDLVALQGKQLVPTVVASNLGDGPATYAYLNGQACWSVEDVATGRIGEDLVNETMGVPLAQLPAVVAGSNGGLPAGDYQVALTYLSASGEEGGATTAQVVAVGANGSLVITLPDPPPGVEEIAIYRSETNGAQLYLAAVVMAGILQYTLGAAPVGQGLETQHMRRLPAGHLLRMLNGVPWMAVGNQVYHGTAMRPFLHHPGHQRLPFQSRISIMETVGEGESAGAFVCSGERTFFLSGGGLAEKMSQRIAYPHGGVPGTGLIVPGSAFGGEYTGLVAYWMGNNGVPCIGLPGGTVVPLTQDTTTMHQFERGASLLREVNGLRSIVTAGSNGSISDFSTQDVGEVTQYRNGIVVP